MKGKILDLYSRFRPMATAYLAFFVLALTIGVYVVTRREPKPTVFVRLLFGCTHGAIILVATLGLVVASLRTP